MPAKAPMHVLVKEIYDMVPIEDDEDANSSKHGGNANTIIDRMVSNDSKEGKSDSGGGSGGGGGDKSKVP